MDDGYAGRSGHKTERPHSRQDAAARWQVQQLRRRDARPIHRAALAGESNPAYQTLWCVRSDFLASFAELTRQQRDATTSPDSENILPALLGDAPHGRQTLVRARRSNSAFTPRGPWKLIEKSKGAKRNTATNTELGNDGNFQLYNLDTDLSESKNISTEYPDKGARTNRNSGIDSVSATITITTPGKLRARSRTGFQSTRQHFGPPATVGQVDTFGRNGHTVPKQTSI